MLVNFELVWDQKKNPKTESFSTITGFDDAIFGLAESPVVIFGSHSTGGHFWSDQDPGSKYSKIIYQMFSSGTFYQHFPALPSDLGDGIWLHLPLPGESVFSPCLVLDLVFHWIV